MINKSKSRKGHVFTIDVVVAVVILIIGLAVIFYAYPSKVKNYYFTEQLSEDMIGVLVETNVKDLCSNPGTAGCDCPNYPEMESLACQPNLINTEANLLELMTEVIQKQSADPNDITELLQEIFVEKNVIDEKRFGFAIIYTTPQTTTPYELYNSDTWEVTP